MKYNELEKLVEQEILAEAKAKSPGVLNWGDVAEGILAAAMVERYIEGDQTVEIGEVYNLIKDCYKNGDKKDSGKLVGRTKTYTVERHPKDLGCKGKNAPTTQVDDEVLLTINLGKVAWWWLYRGSIKRLGEKQEEFDNLVLAAAAHANSEMPKKAKEWECNEKVDYIEVLADGVGDQKGKKTDVEVHVKGKDGKVRAYRGSFGKMSVKTKSQQMAQVGKFFDKEDIKSLGFKQMIKAFFDVTVDAPAYDDVVKGWYCLKEPPEGSKKCPSGVYNKPGKLQSLAVTRRKKMGKMLSAAYGDAFDKLDTIFPDKAIKTKAQEDKDAAWLRNLSDSIITHSQGEKGIYVVKLDAAAKDFSQINYDDIEETFTKISPNLTVFFQEFVYPSTWPRLLINYESENGKEFMLLQARAKVDERIDSKGEVEKRLYHYVEFGDGFKVLLKHLEDAEKQIQEQKTKHLTKTPGSYTMLREMIENLMGEE